MVLAPRRLGTTRFGTLARSGVVLLVVALVAACSGSDGPGRAAGSTTSALEEPAPSGSEPSGSGPFPEGVAVLGPDEDLYARAESPGSGPPGEPIALQPVATDLSARVWRVLYRSASIAGDPIAVSGWIAVPLGDPPEDGRPVVSWAHGTTGLADECAPSRTLAQMEAAIPLLERGMVVAATDYEGLGTPGLHPYLVGESQGRGVLDIVRAAQALGPEVGAGEGVVLWGHSQGGHAVLFANEIAGDWAPELDVVGTVAGAPPSQMPLLLGTLGSGPTSFFLAMVIAGWAEAHRDADPADVLTAAGVERLPVVEEGCVGEVAAAWGAPAAGPLVQDVGDDPPEPWGALFEANEPGRVPGVAPVLVLHGDRDVIVPPVTSALLAEAMCSVGQSVERRTYADADHVSVIPASLAEMLDWMDDRLAGQPSADDCDAR